MKEITINRNEFTIKDGTPCVSSRNIAKRLGKRHDHVLRDIQFILKDLKTLETEGGLPKSGESSVRWFIESSYRNRQNRDMPEYLLTKDGFTLLVMNYQGYNNFKIAYIKKFNQMEQALKEKMRSDLVEENKKLQKRLNNFLELWNHDDEYLVFVLLWGLRKLRKTMAAKMKAINHYVKMGLTAEEITKLVDFPEEEIYRYVPMCEEVHRLKKEYLKKKQGK